MENTDLTLFGNSDLGLVAAIVVCLMGYLVYNFFLVWTAEKVSKFSDIKLKLWWSEHQIPVVLSIALGAILFYVKYMNNDMTVDGMFFVSITSNFMIDRIFKYLHQKKAPSSEENNTGG